MSSIPASAAAAIARPPLGQRILDWLKQPGTQDGLGWIAAGAALAAAHPFIGAEGLGAALIARGIPKILPDNTTDRIKVADEANAIAAAAASRSLVPIEHELPEVFGTASREPPPAMSRAVGPP